MLPGASDAQPARSWECGAHSAAHVATIAEKAAGPPVGHTTDEQQDDEHQYQQPKKTAGPGAPLAAVAPRGQRADEE